VHEAFRLPSSPPLTKPLEILKIAPHYVGVKRLFRKLFGKRKKIHPKNPVVMICPKCGGPIKVVAFITEYAVVDRIMEHLKLTFATEEPPPCHVFEQDALMAAEESGEYF
jgi:hypothetical protein